MIKIKLMVQVIFFCARRGLSSAKYLTRPHAPLAFGRFIYLTSDTVGSVRELAGKGVGVFPFGAGATVLATAVVVEIGTFFWRGGARRGEETC